jgi:hypothetical protein
VVEGVVRSAGVGVDLAAFGRVQAAPDHFGWKSA